MIYNVDTKRINKQIQCLTTCINVLETLGREPLQGPIPSFALARALHISIESVIDIGSVLIDGFIMRDPGGYLDIIEILADEAVISDQLSKELKEFVQLRDCLVRRYDDLEVSELSLFLHEWEILQQFIESVKGYLKKELRWEGSKSALLV